MTVSRAFTYIFDDRDWVNKIVVGTIFTLLTFVFTPFLIGLVGLSLLFGYQAGIIRNIRARAENPLPAWGDLGGMISDGIGVLLAFVVYMLPNLLVSFFSFFVSGLAGDTVIVSGATSIGIACCLFPFVLVYNLIALPMFTIAQGRHAHTRNVREFFRLAALFDVFRTNFDAVVQWWIGTILALVLFSFLGVIPCIGWIAGAALAVPITGALAGMLHVAVDGEKPKKKKS